MEPAMTTLSHAVPATGTNRPVALIEDLKALGRFRSKMAQQALSVNVARMMYDRPYAFDRIALAHSSADESLQRLALQLFAQYSQDDAAAH
jgi:hypothetical protein